MKDEGLAEGLIAVIILIPLPIIDRGMNENSICIRDMQINFMQYHSKEKLKEREKEEEEEEKEEKKEKEKKEERQRERRSTQEG